MTELTPTWVLDVPFEAREWASRQGARWNSTHRVWTYPGKQLPPMLGMFKSQPLSFEWHRQAHLNGGVHLEMPSRQEPFFEPRPHQQEAIVLMQHAKADKSPGFLLADEVGVGKTLSAWGFARDEKTINTVLIITTASAQAHWRRSVLHAGWRKGQAIMIINYDRLDRLFEQPEKGLTSARRKGKRKRIAKQGQAPAYDLVIFDESHKGKNPTSARGLMMQKIAAKAKFCIWASATAGQTPVDLVYLGPLLARATGKKVPMATIEDFAAWCISQGLSVKRGAYGKIEWERNEDDLEKIQSWLFGGKRPVGLRRRPEEVAGWRAMERQMMPIDLPAEARAPYAQLWQDFVAAEMNRSADGKRTPKQRAELETNRMRLRQQSSWLMIPSTVDMVKDLLENGVRVAVSVAFRATQDEMQKQLEQAGVGVAVIHGQLSTTEKENQRLDFQQGRKPVVLFTVEEAISLHQGEYEDVPRVLLVHDLRWSAIQMAQIEGRCHRDGSFAPTWWLAAADTVAMEIAEVMAGRVAGMKAMHGDPVGDLDAIEEVIKAYINKQGKKAK